MNLLGRIRHVLILWFIMGMLYYTMEGIWRGWANIVMLPIGGLCGILIGAINQFPRFYNMRIIWQALIGTVGVLIVEFVSGCVVNLWLGLDVWDYSGRFGNIMGQICIPYAFLWFALIPFAIWLEDRLRWTLWGEGEKYSLKSIYSDLAACR